MEQQVIDKTIELKIMAMQSQTVDKIEIRLYPTFEVCKDQFDVRSRFLRERFAQKHSLAPQMHGKNDWKY